MDIILSIKPSGTLTPEHIMLIAARAAERRQSPEQFVVAAIMEAISVRRPAKPNRRKGATV